MTADAFGALRPTRPTLDLAAVGWQELSEVGQHQARGACQGWRALATTLRSGGSARGAGTPVAQAVAQALGQGISPGALADHLEGLAGLSESFLDDLAR